MQSLQVNVMTFLLFLLTLVVCWVINKAWVFWYTLCTNGVCVLIRVWPLSVTA